MEREVYEHIYIYIYIYTCMHVCLYISFWHLVLFSAIKTSKCGLGLWFHGFSSLMKRNIHVSCRDKTCAWPSVTQCLCNWKQLVFTQECNGRNNFTKSRLFQYQCCILAEETSSSHFRLPHTVTVTITVTVTVTVTLTKEEHFYRWFSMWWATRVTYLLGLSSPAGACRTWKPEVKTLVHFL